MLLAVCVLVLALHGAPASVELGIDVLQKQGFGILQGKRVGLVTNQTGVDSSGRKTRALGVTFSEYSKGGRQGARTTTDLCALGVYMLAYANRVAKPDLFARSAGDKLQMFFKCHGSKSIRSQSEKGVPVQGIVASWNSSLSRFRAERNPFLLYPKLTS